MASLSPSAAASPSGSARVFLNLADGQMSPLDVLVRSTRSAAYNAPFLSPLSTTTTAAKPLPTHARPSTPHSPHSPLLHTRFGTPQKDGAGEPNSPAYSDFSLRSYDVEESPSVYSEMSPTHRRLSYILDQFEKNVLPPTTVTVLDGQGQVPAQPAKSRDVFLSPVPPGKKKLRETPDVPTPSSHGTSPVFPGWEDSYFPPPERYHPPPSSRGLTPLTNPSSSSAASSAIPTPDDSPSPHEPSPATDVFSYRAFEAALSPPLVVVNSPDEIDPDPEWPSSAVEGVFVVEGEAFSPDPEEVYEVYGFGERKAGREKSYTSGNFSMPRISVSPAASPAMPHAALFPSHSVGAISSLSLESEANRTVGLPRSNSQPLSTALASPLQLTTSFTVHRGEPSLTSPPDLSNSASTDADHFPLTPARRDNTTLPTSSARLGVSSPNAGRGPITSVYSEYSFYSLATDESSTTETAGPHTVEDAPKLTKAPSLVRGDSVSGRYVKYQRRNEEPQRDLPLQKPPPPPTSRPPVPPRPQPVTSLPESRRTLSLSTLSSSALHPLTPLQHLHLGITAHESNQLPIAASHFERAAKLGQGCAVGMVMWGLTLRHGWGARQDEKRGFVWLRRGVERAVRELEGIRRGASGDGLGEWGAVKEELVLAVAEVGRCLMHGWGVKQDKKMGFNYFLVAANLGDTDCAQEVGFCYEKGRGVKRDKKEAARWYRKAVKQGLSDVGLAWIWKPKYD